MDAPSPEFAAAVEDAGLLRDEYPDDMARRSCTCEPDATCGAHRLLAHYEQLFQAFQKANREKRQAKQVVRDLTSEVERLREQNPDG